MSRERRDKALFDAIATRYARKDTVPSSAQARQYQLLTALRPLLAQKDNLGTVVDIGCGVGAPAAFLAGRYRRYIGVDQSEEMIRAAAQFNRHLPHVEFIAANVKSETIPDDIADVILSVGALHHMTALDDVMRNLVRVAKPGAALLVVEPQNGNPFIQVMRRLRGFLDQGYSREQKFFSEEQLRALFGRHGITRLTVDYQAFLTPPFAQVILPPQAITAPLSRLAIRADQWVHGRLRGRLRQLSFNIVLHGIFTK
ncbi:MAG: class I SAM-dependent methyltransferase [Anaerolineae bacterium]